MTLATLYPPIAAATVLNAFLFALMWRGHQQDRAGAAPRWLLPGIITYAGAAGLIFYFRSSAPLTGWTDLFCAAFIGEAAGLVVVYALLNAFVFTRGQPWRVRAVPIVGAAFLAVLMFSGAFTG